MTEVPIIDFSEDTVTVARKMHKAFTTVGFAVFTNAYNDWLIDFELWSDLVKEFFDLPQEIKNKYKYSGTNQNLGYSDMMFFKQDPEKPGDLKESYNWRAPSDMDSKYWPIEVPMFRTQAEKIERLMKIISFQFMERFELSLNLKKGFLIEKHLYGTTTARLNYYPKYDGHVEKNQSRGFEHTDYHTFTMLFRFNDCGGLFFKSIDDEWLEVPVIENSIAINIADIFQRWTNDTYISTPHRVMNILDKERYSMPYFVGPNKDVIIKNLTKNTDKYEPISTYDYLWKKHQGYC